MKIPHPVIGHLVTGGLGNRMLSTLENGIFAEENGFGFLQKFLHLLRIIQLGLGSPGWQRG
jgi:hypothetical protein